MNKDRDISINIRDRLNQGSSGKLTPKNLEDAFEIFASKLSIDEGKLLIKNSFIDFNSSMFGEENAEHHIEMCEGLESWEDTCNILPRGSAKSTISSCRYPAWRLGNDRALRIIVMSHTAGFAQTLLRSIEGIFELPLYTELFGVMKPPFNSDLPWNNHEKTVSNRPQYNSLGFRVDTKDPSLFAVGTGGAIVGKRSDILIFDDIIDRRTVKTENQLSDIDYWLKEEVYPTRHFKTQTVVSGTRWGAKDIYIKIMSDMLRDGATIYGNMIEEVKEQIAKYRELEESLVSFS